MDAEPHFLKESVTNYISALSNLLVACILSFDYDQAEVYLRKLKAIKPLSADDKLKIHRQYYTVKFRLCINTGAFEEGFEALEEHFKLLTSGNINSKIFETESFYFQYICIYFGTGVYDKALSYLNQWLNSPKSIERQDLQSFARMINLIIHYEMGNHLLLDSLIRSTYRFLNNRNSLYQMEARMITFIRDVNNAQDRKTKKVALADFKQDLEDQMKDKKVKAMLQLFDLEAWLDSKILNISFAEVVKRKFLQEKEKVMRANHAK
jgi:tetratricopeptide (TPR) repeat protein